MEGKGKEKGKKREGERKKEKGRHLLDQFHTASCAPAIAIQVKPSSFE